MLKKTTPLNKAIELGKKCQQQNNCCKHGSGFLAKGDLEKISKFMKISQDELKEKYLQEKQLKVPLLI